MGKSFVLPRRIAGPEAPRRRRGKCKGAGLEGEDPPDVVVNRHVRVEIEDAIVAWRQMLGQKQLCHGNGRQPLLLQNDVGQIGKIQAVGDLDSMAGSPRLFRGLCVVLPGEEDNVVCIRGSTADSPVRLPRRRSLAPACSCRRKGKSRFVSFCG